jgi:hypothetical protein
MMTEQEKELLLKDLCGRLSYGVKGEVETTDGNGKEIKDEGVLNSVFINEYGTAYICIEGMEYELDDFKPYLRPISCMTDDEVDTLFNVLKIDEKRGDWLKVNDIGIIRLFTEAGKDFYEIAAAFDYLNSIRVDYRGLIEKGLALEAPEGMYEIK